MYLWVINGEDIRFALQQYIDTQCIRRQGRLVLAPSEGLGFYACFLSVACGDLPTAVHTAVLYLVLFYQSYHTYT